MARTNSLLEAVVEGVGGSVFYSAIWECVAVNTSIRLPALTFVLCHLGRRSGALETQQHILGEDIQVNRVYFLLLRGKIYFTNFLRLSALLYVPP